MSSKTQVFDSEARLEMVGAALDGVLRSRWLILLERLEAPVRIVRPGRGTVRVRLETIRRLARVPPS